MFTSNRIGISERVKLGLLAALIFGMNIIMGTVVYT